MSSNDGEEGPDQPPRSSIEQHAGDRATQIGQVIGNVVFQLLTPRTAIAIIGSLVIVAGGFAYLYNAAQKPARMTGDFNIAVAQFGEVTDQGIVPSARATQISKLLFDFLDSEYKATDFGLRVQVAHEKIGILTEDQDAEQLASDINASIVIYGNLFAQGKKATLSPRFYIADRPETAELTGQYRLAMPLQFEISSLDFQDKANAELRSRAAVLVSFTEGLSYLSADNLAGALRSFQQAIREVPGQDQYPGQEVLYLLKAITVERQGRVEQAFKDLDQALQLNPEYARAYFARGNIYYAQAIRAANDVNLLNQALAEYEKAIEAHDQPAGAYVIDKTNVSLGNAYVLQAQQTGDPQLFNQAIDHYNEVVTQYERIGDEKIRYLAARAYFGLGIAYERQNDFTRAAPAYQKCAELTRDAQIKSMCELQLGVIKGQK